MTSGKYFNNIHYSQMLFSMMSSSFIFSLLFVLCSNIVYYLMIEKVYDTCGCI